MTKQTGRGAIRPDLTVIVPCYNAERYLDVCLSSIQMQTGPSLQILLVDDGSTDATGAILDRYAAQDGRAQAVHTQNRGVSAARNLGLSLARGRYIAFVDADDALEENAFSLLFQAAKKEGAGIVSAGHTLFDTQTQRRIRVEPEGLSNDPAQVVRQIIHMHRIYNNLWNKLYDAALFRNGPRLQESVKIGEDALLNLELYLAAEKIVHIPAYTYVYRVHSASAMAGIGDYAGAHLPMLRAMSGILLSHGVKGLYFRDFLESCVWIHEKETGIRPAMRRFQNEIRPLVMEGLCERDIPEKDLRLYRAVERGTFPALYTLSRIRKKLTGSRGKHGEISSI